MYSSKDYHTDTPSSLIIQILFLETELSFFFLLFFFKSEFKKNMDQILLLDVFMASIGFFMKNVGKPLKVEFILVYGFDSPCIPLCSKS